MSGVCSASNSQGEQHQPGEGSRFQVVRTLDGGGGKAQQGWAQGHWLAQQILGISSSLGASLTEGALLFPENTFLHVFRGRPRKKGSHPPTFVISAT